MHTTHPSARSAAQFQIRRRSSLAQTYVVVSQVIVLGYTRLSDGAKITYLAIATHDWYDEGRGGRKGFVFPTIRRLTQLRGVSERTIQNHLTELIASGLITREARRGQSNVLYIEEPAADEVDRLRERLTTRGGEDFFRGGVQKFAPHKQEEEKQEESVNGIQKDVMDEAPRKASGWRPVGLVLKARATQSSSAGDRATWLTDEMVRQTGDTRSRACYRTLAQRCPEETIFESLALLKEARTDGTRLRSKGAFFVSTIRKLCTRRGLKDPLSHG